MQKIQTVLSYILDDCAASKDVKTQTSELVDLAFSGRHIGLNTIVVR